MAEITISAAITAGAAFCLLLTVIGLPGNWIMVATAAGMTFYASDGRLYAMSATAFGVAVVLAVLGEVVEFAAGAAGVKKQGGSRRAAVLAICGSIVGAVTGLFVGSPVPIIGSVVVSLMLGAAGAAAGAALGEKWAGRQWGAAAAVGNAAFWGRLLGTLGKLICSAVILAVIASAAWLRGSV